MQQTAWTGDMGMKRVHLIIWVVLAAGVTFGAECCEDKVRTHSENDTRPPERLRENTLDEVLGKLHETTSQMRTYQGLIEYKTMQPVHESETLRKGALYYTKTGEKSKLRMNFKTLKQDDEKEQKYVEHFIFDGVWLTKLNYQTKTATKYQVAEFDKPVDAFTAANEVMPMVGFMDPEELMREFEVSLVKPDSGNQKDFVQIHLKVKPSSKYQDDYLTIDFWINRKLWLPSKVRAVSTEPAEDLEDVHELRFLKPQIDRRISRKVFDFKIPAGFSEPEIVPLKKEGQGRHR
jgi:hypothetical protein